jgi:hypothetical protein
MGLMKPTPVKGLLVLLVLVSLIAMPVAAQVETFAGDSGRCCGPPPINMTQLTETEKHWLNYMREEEKLARDIYLLSFDLWGLRIFENIPMSEQRHMDAVKSLLDKYGLQDPAGGNGLGEFTNPELQALYDDLAAMVAVSVVDALNVGVLIEEKDIADLKDGISTAKHTDIKNVYTNLLEASYHHLDAFNYNLSRY